MESDRSGPLRMSEWPNTVRCGFTAVPKYSEAQPRSIEWFMCSITVHHTVVSRSRSRRTTALNVAFLDVDSIDLLGYMTVGKIYSFLKTTLVCPSVHRFIFFVLFLKSFIYRVQIFHVSHRKHPAPLYGRNPLKWCYFLLLTHAEERFSSLLVGIWHCSQFVKRRTDSLFQV